MTKINAKPVPKLKKAKAEAVAMAGGAGVYFAFVAEAGGAAGCRSLLLAVASCTAACCGVIGAAALR